MDLNYLNAKLLKAEMLGNQNEVNDLKQKIEEIKRSNSVNSSPSLSTNSSDQSSLSTNLSRYNELNGSNANLLKTMNTVTTDELNQLNAKLLKAEMLNNVDQINELKERIEQLNQSSIKANSSYSSARTINNFGTNKFTQELNQLNAKLIKAEILKNKEQIEEYETKIKELKKKIGKESGNDDQDSENESIEDSKRLEELNRLNAKLIKAEITGNQDLIKECKKSIGELKCKEEKSPEEESSSTKLVKKENKEVGGFDFSQIFEELVQANKVNDKKKVDSLKEQINNYECEFNFRRRDDITEILRIANESLNETMKLKTKEELEGSSKTLINDLDKRAKAIRKKVIEYTDKLNELIKKETKEQKKSPEFLRVHPEYVDLYGPNRLKKELQKNEAKQDNGVKTVHVVKKLNEDNMSLKQMFVIEKRTTRGDNEDSIFVNAASRLGQGEDDEYEGSTSAAKRKKTSNDSRYFRKEEEEDEKCNFCLEKTKKQLIISYDEKVFLVIPERKPLVDHQLIIRGTEHFPSLVSSSEDACQIVNQYKQKLCILYESLNKKPIFVEYFLKHQTKWNKHFEIHCFPIKAKFFEESKLWFKKEISDAEGEYTMNKKLIFLNNEKSVNKMVPKELSYFCVTFGISNDGFAHVIEDKKKFSRHFAQEIIGGLLDLDPQSWLNPEFQNYDQQLERSTELKKLWSRFEKLKSYDEGDLVSVTCNSNRRFEEDILKTKHLTTKLPVPEPQDVERASTVSFNEIKKELDSIKSQIKIIEERYKRVIDSCNQTETKTEDLHIEPFQSKMKTMIEYSTKIHQEHEESLEECQQMFNDTIQFFAYKPKSSNLAEQQREFFMIWQSFCTNFKDLFKKVINAKIKEVVDNTKQNANKIMNKNIKKIKDNEKKALSPNGLKARLIDKFKR